MSLIYKGQTIAGAGGSGSSSSGSSEEVYSTEETRIGTWIDGKPLYRKTISFTIPYVGGTDSSYTYDNAVSNVDTLAFVYGSWLNYGNNERSSLIYRGSTAESIWFKSLLYGSQIIFGVSNMNDARSGVITLGYTKTTDEATS